MVLERKIRYRKKLLAAFAQYTNMLVISIDFVGSKQLQQVRMATRGKATIVLGKNTLLRKVVRDLVEEGNTKLEALLPLIQGNMGLIFTDEDLKQLRDSVTSNQVPAAAKAGVIAPVTVVIPAGPSGLDPGEFFSALPLASIHFNTRETLTRKLTARARTQRTQVHTHNIYTLFE
jgi:large subunit ribosomal protein LP0